MGNPQELLPGIKKYTLCYTKYSILTCTTFFHLTKKAARLMRQPFIEPI